MTQVNTILFQDTININDMDSGGKKFGRGNSEAYNITPDL